MNSLNEAGYCRINVPGTEIAVRLRLGVLERMTSEVEDVLAATGRESGGILLGSVSSNGLVIEDYDPVPSRYSSDSRFYLYADVDRERMAGAVALWSPKGESRLRAIGFYRSNDRPALLAADEERQMFAQELKGAASVLLLVEPAANGRAALACYLAEPGAGKCREARLEIDLNKPGADVMEAPEHVNAPCCEAKPRTAPARSRKPSSGLARIAVLSLTAGMLWLGFLQYRILRAMNTEALMGGGAAALGLDVRPSGSYWRVTWNRSSAYVNGAARGYLRIEDGARRKDVELDASELRNSSVIYDPAGNEISVHLEVFGAEGGRSTAETLHLFAALPPADGRETARTEITPVDRLNAADVVNSGRQARSDSLPIIPEH